MDEEMIPLTECVDRHVYRLRARNFRYGVFNAETNGFIGIRQKFERRYLFTEYHWEFSESVGTARPIKDLGRLPDNRIKLWERYPGTMCRWCGKGIHYVEELRPPEGPYVEITDPALYPWQHDEPSDECTEVVDPYSRGPYLPLFEALEDFEEEEDAEWA